MIVKRKCKSREDAKKAERKLRDRYDYVKIDCQPVEENGTYFWEVGRKR